MNLVAGLDLRSGLMHRMMARLGIDIEKAALLALGTQLSGAARTCAFCSHAATCQAWFDRGASDGEWRSFCPNARRFEKFRSL